jgi:hypothetical protein
MFVFIKRYIKYVKLKYLKVNNKIVGDKTYCFLVGFCTADHYIQRKFKSCPISRSKSKVYQAHKYVKGALNHERVIYEPHFPSTETNICQQETQWYRSSAVWEGYCANSLTISIMFVLPWPQSTRYDLRITQIARVCYLYGFKSCGMWRCVVGRETEDVSL